MLHGLDLFSGIGGLTVALRDWVRPVAYCEIDEYCQGVLLSRMADGSIPGAPIWSDIRSLSGADLPEIDIIYGGFPCQDISVAGLGKGLEGERSGLFFEILRLAKEIKPTFIFLENVPAIRTRGLKQIGEGLASAGYDCRWDVISIEETQFEGKRWYLLAASNCDDLRIQSGRSKGASRPKEIQPAGVMENGKDTAVSGERSHSPRAQFRTEKEFTEFKCAMDRDDWDKLAELFCRIDNDVPYRSHRLKALGNAVVPLQAKTAFERLMGLQLITEK